MNYEDLPDPERDELSVSSLTHIGNELQTLVALRSRIRYARKLLMNGAPTDDVIDVLDGEEIPVPLRPAAGE